MSKGLVSTLTYIYRFINLGRGILTADELMGMESAAHTMTFRAKDVLNANAESEQVTNVTAVDLNQAAMIEQHIEESIEWQLRQEII